MFPAFSLPCRVCRLLSCHVECTRAGSAPSFEGQVPLWGGGLCNILGGAILLWHTWVASSMPWVGSAPPCGDQVPTWGQGPCTYTWWRRALLIASLVQVLPLYHPPVTGMLVWHVGTRPHVAHRQSFRWADYLDRLSSLNFGPAVLMCLWPFGSGRTTNAAMRWGILHLQRQGVAGWKAGWHLTRRCPDSATQPPCADYSRLLVMRKSCKMDTWWASC